MQRLFFLFFFFPYLCQFNATLRSFTDQILLHLLHEHLYVLEGMIHSADCACAQPLTCAPTHAKPALAFACRFS